MQDDASNLSSEVADQLKSVREDIQDSLSLLTKGQKTQEIDSGDVLAKLKDTVDLLRKLVIEVPQTNRVLARLYFDAIFDREDQIVNPSDNTFAWMTAWPENSISAGADPELISSNSKYQKEIEKALLHEDTAKSFRKYLRSDGGTYFICGKAGCGKSTMMKHLARSPQVHDELKAWALARQRSLIMIEIFFWKSGDSLERSCEGFYRSILFRTLRQCPDMIKRVFQTKPWIQVRTMIPSVSLSQI